MAKHPVNFTVKDSTQAVKRLNDIVEQGGYKFDIGVNEEYVTTVSKNSDGTTSTEKEKVFRIIGFADYKEGKELSDYLSVKKERETLKKERDEMDRNLNLLNGVAFGPLSIFLVAVGVFASFFGILTLAKVLPLPAEQIGISIVLTIVGVLALAGCVLATVVRGKKIKLIQSRRGEIEKANEELKVKESKIDSKTPSWYLNALWSNKGNTVFNSQNQIIINK